MTHAANIRKTPKITVVGSSIMDLVTYTKKFPMPGETVIAERFETGFGGKGANQAVAAKKCGADVSMVSCVGDDTFGTFTNGNFVKLGIDEFDVYPIKGESTGAAAIMVNTETGQNQIAVAIGANKHITPEIIDKAAENLENADTIIMQCEMPIETVYHTVEFARNHGKRSILNVAPAQAVDFKKLEGLDYIIVNESEAETVSGVKVTDMETAEAAAQKILGESTIKNVIVTLGEKGAKLVKRDGPDISIPAFQVNTVDTTGAGDAFIGSFATFLSSGVQEEEALKRASLYAAMSTTKPGTQKSYPENLEFSREWEKRSRGAAR